MMLFSKIKIFALLALSIAVLSGCEVYRTLYGEIPTQTNTTFDDIASGEANDIVPENQPAEDSGQTEAEKPANAIIVQESELVNLEPKAEDPDADQLAFTFTSPLDEKGQWQTAYGDEGEYTVTVTASDGQLTTSQDVLIVVKKKEEAPVMEGAKPIETAVFADEASKTEFSVTATDLNNDQLTYEWKLDGESVGSNRIFEYSPDYEAAGSHTLKIDVSDGTSSVSQIWSITINNVNRVPELKPVPGIKAREDDEVAIVLEAFDEDGDALTYNIDDPRFKEESEGTFSWKTDYGSSGNYVVKASVSDGHDTAGQDVNIEIENVNRAPLILDIVQKK